MSYRNDLTHVFLLTHEYQGKDGEEEYKILGVFVRLQEAIAARRKAAKLPGFKKYPRSFSISKMTLGHMSWADGFVTLPPPRRMTEEEWQQFQKERKKERKGPKPKKGPTEDVTS